MANNGDQERTEEATPRKREEARNEGKIPRSPELTTAVVLLAGALILSRLGPALGDRMAETMQAGLLLAGAAPLDAPAAIAMVREFGWKVMAALSVVVLSMGLAAGGTAAIQARGILTTQPLEPKWDRLNPLPALKKFLGMEPWVDLLKSFLKLLIVGVAVWYSVGPAWNDSLALAQMDPVALLGVVRTHCVRLLMIAGLCYLGFAAADYFYQIWQHEKSLMMSKQEIKEESKANEGDPMIKARMRAIGRSYARRQMFQEVPKADVVVTNPTHIAIALKYDPAVADAPVVVAMGQRKVAERIKAIAKEAGVPTVENKPLARALLASARVGTPIPPDFYLAVAEVLAWVISKRGRLRGVQA